MKTGHRKKLRKDLLRLEVELVFSYLAFYEFKLNYYADDI